MPDAPSPIPFQASLSAVHTEDRSAGEASGTLTARALGTNQQKPGALPPVDGHGHPPAWARVRELLRPVQPPSPEQAPVPASWSAAVDRCLQDRNADLMWARMLGAETPRDLALRLGITRARAETLEQAAWQRLKRLPELLRVNRDLDAETRFQGVTLLTLNAQDGSALLHSRQRPDASPEQLLRFLVLALNQTGRRRLSLTALQAPLPASPVRTRTWLLSLWSPITPAQVEAVFRRRPRFVRPSVLAALLHLPLPVFERLAPHCAALRRTGAGYGWAGWEQNQWMQAVAGLLWQHGVTHWHYSAIGQLLTEAVPDQFSGYTPKQFERLRQGNAVFTPASPRGHWQLSCYANPRERRHAMVVYQALGQETPLGAETLCKLLPGLDLPETVALLDRDPGIVRLDPERYTLVTGSDPDIKVSPTP